MALISGDMRVPEAEHGTGAQVEIKQKKRRAISD